MSDDRTERQDAASIYKAAEDAVSNLDEAARRVWIREHWNGFLRARWIEHIEGRSFWIELDHNDFGLLQYKFKGSPYLEQIISMLKAGQENLNVLNWATENNLPMDEVLEILEEVDVNSRRLAWRFSKETEIRDRVKSSQPKPQVLAYFDGTGFTDRDIALCLSYLSEVYRDLGGFGLKVVAEGRTLVPEAAEVPL